SRAQGNRIKKGAKPGTACVHNALDDHSRLAYSEVLPDETKETTAAFWHRANDYFAACGIIVKRVLTDNGSAYRPKAFATALGDHARLAYSVVHPDETKQPPAAFWHRANDSFAACGIIVKRVLTDNGSAYRSKASATALGEQVTHNRARPYRPQTNGKVERFNRTLEQEWAYARPYTSEAERLAELPAFLHTYNHHRGHTALKGHPPASRVPNLCGDNIYQGSVCGMGAPPRTCWSQNASTVSFPV